MSSAYRVLRESASRRIKNLDLDPDTDIDRIRVLLDEEIRSYQVEANLGVGERPPLADPQLMFDRLDASFLGFGVLTEMLQDPDVEEIFVEGSDVYCIDGAGRLRSSQEVVSADELYVLINRLLADTGRELTHRSPMVQARVLGGTARLGVVAPPIADRLSVTLRKYRIKHESFEQLVGYGAFTPAVADLLKAAMQAGSGVLVCGRPGSGKTTLMNACLRAVPAVQRVLCCEEVRELSAPLNHGSYYQARQTDSADDATEVSLRDLVKMCLGMRPDLLVIGEVRSAEAFELLRAGNAGCGVMATVHANSAADAMVALVDTAIMAGQNVPAHNVRSTFSQIFDLIVFLDREDPTENHAGPIRRQVLEVAAVLGAKADADDFSVVPLLRRREFDAPLERTGTLPEALMPRVERQLARTGTTLWELLAGHPIETPLGLENGTVQR